MTRVSAAHERPVPHPTAVQQTPSECSRNRHSSSLWPQKKTLTPPMALRGPLQLAAQLESLRKAVGSTRKKREIIDDESPVPAAAGRHIRPYPSAVGTKFSSSLDAPGGRSSVSTKGQFGTTFATPRGPTVFSGAVYQAGQPPPWPPSAGQPRAPVAHRSSNDSYSINSVKMSGVASTPFSARKFMASLGGCPQLGEGASRGLQLVEGASSSRGPQLGEGASRGHQLGEGASRGLQLGEGASRGLQLGKGASRAALQDQGDFLRLYQ
jgi:hypothetical protein